MNETHGNGNLHGVGAGNNASSEGNTQAGQPEANTQRLNSDQVVNEFVEALKQADSIVELYERINSLDVPDHGLHKHTAEHIFMMTGIFVHEVKQLPPHCQRLYGGLWELFAEIVAHGASLRRALHLDDLPLGARSLHQIGEEVLVLGVLRQAKPAVLDALGFPTADNSVVEPGT